MFYGLLTIFQVHIFSFAPKSPKACLPAGRGTY
jgi:hypothetical protein